MAGQGHYISGETIQRVIHLLNSTEMTIREVAERMSISKSAVFAINRRFHVREYDGLRTRWRNANAPALTQMVKNSA
jgi:ribosomal protein L10